VTSTLESGVERTGPPRIAFYTHDTFGMGHVRRCMNLIEAMAKRRPDAAILLITGSPALGLMSGRPHNVDVVKLPTIAPTGVAANHPPHLPIGTEAIIRIRRKTIAKLVEAFAPDVFVVDNFALGARRELVPTLKALKNTPTRAVLGVRDIVDAPEVIHRRWAKDGIFDALRDLYDQVLVFGESRLFDAGRQYDFDAATAAKVRHCGYVVRPGPRGGSGFDEFGMGPSWPRLLATVGGGGDGLPLLDAVLGALERLPDCSAVVLSGPLQGQADREAVLGRVAALGPRVVVKPFVEDPTRLMAEADLVVSMAGYNTVAELLRHGARMLLVPRNWRYGEHAQGTAAGVELEQPLRARILVEAGLAAMVDPAELSAETLAAEIRANLAEPRAPRIQTVNFEGAETAAGILDALIGERRVFNAV
jgi:predicted glycosyltransferase